MKKALFAISLCILVVALIVAIWACFSGINIEASDLRNMMKPPSNEHYFGTDMLGRDVFLRIIFGLRVSLIVGFFSAFFGCLIGVIYALFVLISPKFVAGVLAKINDFFLSLPTILFVMFFCAIFKASILSVIIIISLTSWMQTAKVMKDEFTKISKMSFIDTAIILGASKISLIFREILPNCINILLVLFSVSFAHAISTEAVLSFFGLGIPLTTPSLGNMLNNAVEASLLGLWWVVFFPGFTLFVVVMALLIISDYLGFKR
ncbi:MAG: ABC transporter permease [Campylobacter sp.]|nr:ABC transporter permease [Campylobacter sp.]